MKRKTEAEMWQKIIEVLKELFREPKSKGHFNITEISEKIDSNFLTTKKAINQLIVQGIVSPHYARVIDGYGLDPEAYVGEMILESIDAKFKQNKRKKKKNGNNKIK